jgi:PAS domain S-box-containing protein
MTSALQDSEERYRQLFVGSRAVELLIDPEDGGRIVDANAAAARFYGLTVEDLRRMRISDINILSDEEVKAEMAHAAAQRRDHFLFRHRLANGDVRDVEVHSGPLPLGPRRLLYSIIHDVTERRQAEIALAVSEARFRALFEDSPLAIQVVDPDGRTMRVNRAWQSLWMRDPAKDPGPMDDPQLVRTRVVASLRAAYDGSTVEIPPFRYVLPTAPDNPVRWIRAYAYPIRDPGGQGNQLIIVWEDVSEKLGQEERLKETLSELERSNNDLEQFAYVASHDLQEPLRMISSYIGLLQRRYGGDLAPEALEFMGYAVDGAHRMQNIINDLLTYSRVGRKGRPFTWCALAEMVKVACDSLAVAIEDAQAEVTVDGTLPVVLGDAHELGRLFQNLIGNAVKYARPETPPRIRIACAAVDGAWRVTVDDNGIGVAAEFRDRIFQIFQRLHSRSEYGGTGVGLAICKKIVERHGGRIGVEDGPGGGSRFWFTLAMAPAEEEGGSAAETPPLSWADPARP